MKKLLICIPQGRLGNLAFQYQAAAKLSAEGWVLALDSEYFDIFEKPRHFVVMPMLKRFLWQAQQHWTRFFSFLARHKLIGTIEPRPQIILDQFISESSEVDVQYGYLRRVFMIKGFFQNTQYLHPLPTLKPKLRLAAEQQLADVTKQRRVAIHMRFGDFINWPVLGQPGAACLPDSYYLDAIDLIRQRCPDAHLILFSDEPNRARAVFKSAWPEGRITSIDTGSAKQDFVLITACSHAVIAASSFSWWAASLIDNPDRMLIAPLYWAGFRRNTWYPAGVQSAHFSYLLPATTT